jgi:hypothetical protein
MVMPDGKTVEEELNMRAFILIGHTVYTDKNNPEKAMMVPETCSNLNHRADMVDLIEKWKLQLYLSSMLQVPPQK